MRTFFDQYLDSPGGIDITLDFGIWRPEININITIGSVYIACDRGIRSNVNGEIPIGPDVGLSLSTSLRNRDSGILCLKTNNAMYLTAFPDSDISADTQSAYHIGIVFHNKVPASADSTCDSDIIETCNGTGGSQSACEFNVTL
jgi:hypothetical protein